MEATKTRKEYEEEKEEREQKKLRKQGEYTLSDALNDLKNGNTGKAFATGFGEIAKTMLEKLPDKKDGDIVVDGQSVSQEEIDHEKAKEDGAESFGKITSALSNIKGAVADLGENSGLDRFQLKGLAAIGTIVDKVMETGQDQELTYGDEVGITFGKEGDTVKAFNKDGEEMNFGDVFNTTSGFMQQAEQNQTKALDNLIEGFKGAEMEAKVGENAIGGFIGMFANMLGLKGNEQPDK